MARKRAESGAEKGFAPSFAFNNPFAGEACEEEKSDMTWEQRDSQLGEMVYKTEKAGLLHLKTISGWTPKWCKINFIMHNICIFNDENDGTARAMIELKNVLVRAIDDDEGQPYVFVLHANKNTNKVTHKLSSTSKRDFDQWIDAFGAVTTLDRQRERRSARLSPEMIPSRKTVTERSIKHQNMNTQAILQGGRKRQSAKLAAAPAKAVEVPPAVEVLSAKPEMKKEASVPRLPDSVIVTMDDGYSRKSEEDVTFETTNPAVFEAGEKGQPVRTRSRKRLVRGRSYSQLPPDERKAMRDAQGTHKRTPSQTKRNPTLDLIEQVVLEEEEGLEFPRIAPIEDDTLGYMNGQQLEGRRSFSLAELAAFAASKVTSPTSAQQGLQSDPDELTGSAPKMEQQRPPPLEAVDTHASMADVGTPTSGAIREAQMNSAQVINETSAHVARIQYVPRKSGIRIRAIHHVGDSMQLSDDDLRSISAGSDDHGPLTPASPSDGFDPEDHRAQQTIPSPPSAPVQNLLVEEYIQVDLPPPPPLPPSSAPAAQSAQLDEYIEATLPPPPPPAATADSNDSVLAVPPPNQPVVSSITGEAGSVAIANPATEFDTVESSVREAQAVVAVKPENQSALPPPPAPPLVQASDLVDPPAPVAVQTDHSDGPDKADALAEAEATVAIEAIATENSDSGVVPAEEPAASSSRSAPPKLGRSRNGPAVVRNNSREEKKSKGAKSKNTQASNPLLLSRRVVAAPKASSNSKKCGYLQWRNEATAEWILQWCALDFAADVLDIYTNEKAAQPVMSFSLESARLTGRLVPRAIKAIKIRDEQAKGIHFMRPKKHRNQAEIPQEFSDRSLANTIVAQDKLILTLMRATRVGPDSTPENVSLKCISPKDFEDWVRTFRLVVQEVQEDPNEPVLEPRPSESMVVSPIMTVAGNSSHKLEDTQKSASEAEAEERKSDVELVDDGVPDRQPLNSPVSVTVRSTDLSKREESGRALSPLSSNSPDTLNRFRSMSREDRQAMLSRRKAGPAPKSSSSSKKCGYLQWKHQAAGDWALKWCALDFASDVLDLYDTDQSQHPLVSYCLDEATLAGRFVPRAMKAISNREQEAKGMKSRSRFKRNRAPEKSDKPLTETIVPQDKLTFTIRDVVVVELNEAKQDIAFRCISPKDFEDWVRHFRMVVAEVQENVDKGKTTSDTTPNIYNVLSPEALIVDAATAEQPRRRGIFGALKRRSAAPTTQRHQQPSQSVADTPPPRRSGLRGFFSRRRSHSNPASEDSTYDNLARKGSMVVEMDTDTLQAQRQDMTGELQYFRDQFNVGNDDDTESVVSVATADSPLPPPPPAPALLAPLPEDDDPVPAPAVDPVQAALALHAEQLAAYKPTVDAQGVLVPPPLPFRPPPPPSRTTEADSADRGILAQLQMSFPTKPSAAASPGGGLLQELSALRGSLRHIPLVVDTTARGRSRTSSRIGPEANSPVDDILRLRAHVAGDDSEDDSDSDFEDDF